MLASPGGRAGIGDYGDDGFAVFGIDYGHFSIFIPVTKISQAGVPIRQIKSLDGDIVALFGNQVRSHFRLGTGKVAPGAQPRSDTSLEIRSMLLESVPGIAG